MTVGSPLEIEVLQNYPNIVQYCKYVGVGFRGFAFSGTTSRNWERTSVTVFAFHQFPNMVVIGNPYYQVF
jgi:hypothetical protein